MGRPLALHAADLDLILGTLCGPQSLLGVIVERKARSKTQLQLIEPPKQNKKLKDKIFF